MKNNRHFLFPSALFIGLILILLPIFIVMTADRINRQKELFEQQMTHMGTYLIRTFEASTRAGMFNMKWGAHRIQALLKEAAQQPNVAYMMIITPQGRILSHSNEKMVGMQYNPMPDITPLKKDPSTIFQRQVPGKTETQLFQVYKRFVPHRGKMMGRHGFKGHMSMKKMKPHDPSYPPQMEKKKNDWSLPYHGNHGNNQPATPENMEHYIFAALSVKDMTAAKDRLLKTTIFQAIVYFLLMVAGVVAVMAFQSYKSARTSLKNVKAFSDTVIQHMPAGLITTDLNGRVTAMNTMAKDIFGELEIVHQKFSDLTRETQSGQTHMNSEVSINTPDDSDLLLDLNISQIQDAEGAASGFLFLFKDLTQVRELTRQVETNKRLAAIGKLAGGVAHEIRNPLSSIKGFATYFGKRYEDNASDRKTAAIMVNEVDRINRSITQLLEFAKPLAVKKTNINIQHLINHSLKLVEHDLVKKEIAVTVKIETLQTDIFTDKDRLNQVLLNLYMNALNALEPKGNLDILVTDAKKDRLQISVTDDGCGMDRGIQTRIFEPYFTTRNNGTGLGLAIVHRIMENLGGSIHVESEKGKGSCLMLELPAGETADDT